ncbi:ferredoxin [Streptomyces sp. NPDC003362]
MSAVRVVADSERCVGAGQCVLAAGDLFDQDLDGLVTQLTDGTVSGTAVERAREAAHLCPAAAITVVQPGT